MLRLVTLSLSLVLPVVAAAQAPPPPFVPRGLDQLVQGHPDSAVAILTWAWNSPDDLAKRTVLIDAFRQLPQFAGPVLGYEVIRIIEVSPHLRRAYFLLRCERQPAYLLITLYLAKEEWSITTINWHTDPDRVLPTTLFGVEHPKP